MGNYSGVVRVSMTPLNTVEEMDCAVDKAATLLDEHSCVFASQREVVL